MMDSHYPDGLPAYDKRDTVKCLNIISGFTSKIIVKIGYWCEESYEEACGIA